jgi:hyaluronoglucosaminidase
MNIRSIILRFTILQVLGCLAAPVLNCQSTEPSNYRVDLPDTIIPLPYHSEKDIRPGFKIRGIKGYAWTPGQYLAEIPTLAAGKANFLMNCYLSMFSPREKPIFKYGTFLDSIENTWWSPLPADRKAEWIKVIKACEENNIDFCFSMNPQLLSDRPLKTDSDGDFELLRKHYEWAQQNGVRWFSLCLDDVDEKMVEVEGRKHALLANRLFEALKANDNDASFAFCPTWYWGTGSDPGHRLYLEALADALDPEIYVFWTGPYVVPVHITTAEALEFRRIIKHKIILWDNYPVNDNHPAIHLGPLTGRDKDLCEVVDGYMSNSMGSQSDINSIPVLTALDYAYNPGEYDPYRSAGQVIAHMTPDRICQQVWQSWLRRIPAR